MSLDSEQLGIPDTEYASVVTMPSSEFSKNCKELSQINEASTPCR
jgi:proliferating cell nuclear antigen